MTDQIPKLETRKTQRIGGLARWWRRIKRMTIVVGVLLSFFAVIELLRAYQTLHDIHPWLGLGFAIVMFGLIVLGGAWFYREFFSQPPVLRPPNIDDFGNCTLKDARRYANYLTRYLQRLSANHNLPEEQRREAAQAARRLFNAQKAAPNAEYLIDFIVEIETASVDPILVTLRTRGEREVQKCVRDIMIGVSVSPYRSADLFIVVYRNAAMVARLIRVYNSRPRFSEQILIFGDVLRVVATVNFLNLGEKLLERLFSKVPVVGPIVDDLGQGLGAGILTSAMGHAAIQRCAAFRGWDKEEAVQTLNSHLKHFIVDVKRIFVDDVFDRFKNLHRSQAPEDESENRRYWESIKSGIDSALDGTGKIVDGVVIRPVAAGGRGVAYVSGGLARVTYNSVKSTGRTGAAAVRQTGRGIKKLGRKLKLLK